MSRISLLPKDVDMVYVEIRKPSRSFFGKLSEYGMTKISLEVIKVCETPIYLVFAHFPTSDLSNRHLREYRHILSRSSGHIKKFRWWNDGKVTYILAYKTRCDFMRMAEENRVSILSPYVFERGVRKYVAVGRRENLLKYFEDLRRHYGAELVSYTSISDSCYLSSVLVGRSIPTVVTNKLTSNELNVLRSAYNAGYFECPRKADLNDLSKSLGLSKVTVDIHIRKAVKKIVDEMFKFLP